MLLNQVVIHLRLSRNDSLFTRFWVIRPTCIFIYLQISCNIFVLTSLPSLTWLSATCICIIRKYRNLIFSEENELLSIISAVATSSQVNKQKILVINTIHKYDCFEMFILTWKSAVLQFNIQCKCSVNK